MSRGRPHLLASEHALARWALRTGRDPFDLPDAWQQAVFVGQVAGQHNRRLFGYQVDQVVIVVRYRGPRRKRHQQWEALSVWHVRHWEQWRKRTERGWEG